MLAESWGLKRLDQLGSVGRGKSKHRPRDERRLYGGPYPFFQTGDVKAANFWLTEFSQTYSEFGLAQSKLWPKGTLCITIAANIGDSAILGIPGCFPDSVVGFNADQGVADVRFVKYSIDTLKSRMQGISRGTTQDNLSLDKLLSFDFPAPLISIQQRIASILSAYDDLIENNRKRIAILEDMARRLYREWFVHFRYPGHESVPLIDSPLGRIPQGWEFDCLRNVIRRHTSGRVYQKDETVPIGEFPIFDQSTDDVVGYHNDEPGIAASSASPIGLFGDHTCKMQLLISPCSVGPNVVSFVAGADIPTLFIYHAMIGLISTQEYKRHWTQLGAKQVFLPAKPLTNRFTEIVSPMVALQETLRLATRNLRRTRDLLLPRLMSGTLSVTAAEAAAP